MTPATLFNRKHLPLAKALRQNSTDVENQLWYHLRGRRLSGYKFRRQVPIGQYILDFYCVEKKLAIELDGGQHAKDGILRQDKERTEALRKWGVSTILRFWNSEVLEDIDSVLTVILDTLSMEEETSPLSSPTGEDDKL